MLITGAYGAGTAMIKVEKKGDGTYAVSELFKNPDFGAHTQPPVLHDGHFYSHYTINERSDGLVAMSMDGQIKWKTDQQPPFVRGGSILADGLLLMTDGNTKLYLDRAEPRRVQAARERRDSRAGRQLGAAGARRRQAARARTEGAEGAAGRSVSAQHVSSRPEIAREKSASLEVVPIGDRSSVPPLRACSARPAPSTAQALKDVQTPDTPLVLKAQGSFFVGGEKVEQTQGELGDLGPGGHITVNQMYVRYMVPQGGDGNVPVVMVHGATLTGKSWETTPDGRMGWDEYFVRKGHPVYVPDQVGRGRSGFNQAVFNNVRAGSAPANSLPRWLRFSDEVVWPNFRFGSKAGRSLRGQPVPGDRRGRTVEAGCPRREFWRRPHTEPHPQGVVGSRQSSEWRGADGALAIGSVSPRQRRC